MFDSIIIGGGPAGVTAAIYLARKKLNILLLAEDIGGQMAKAGSIENYPGTKKISGVELTGKFHEHLEEYKIENKNEVVKKIQKNADGFEVETSQAKYQTQTVLVCSGKSHRHLEVPGEEKFVGKGISYCATCDAPLFQNKTVVVVGGGNSALDASLAVEKYANKVSLLNIGPEIQGDAILVEKFKKSDKAEIINNAQTLEISGEQTVKSLKYLDKNSNQEKEINCDGIFVEIGWTPSTGFLKNLIKLNQMGEIEVDQNGKTSVDGIFAAGDVTNSSFKQIIIAAGDGAKVALSAWKYLLLQRVKS